MFGKVFNNLEWKKIASSEFNSFKQFRQDLRSKLIKANKNKGKKIPNNPKYTSSNKIFKFSPRKDKNQIIILNKCRSFCQNNFCFPIKENFIVPNCYTLKYIELFDNFEFFDKTMSNFFLKIKGLYEFYPKTLDERERLDNKDFILWMFITSIKYLDSKKYIFKKKEDMIELIKIISEMINKDFKYLYQFLSKYLIQINDKVKSEINKTSLTNYFNYRKYYCSVCKQYLCSKHYYKTFKRPEIENNVQNYFFIESDLSSYYSQEINYVRPKRNDEHFSNGINSYSFSPINLLKCKNCEQNESEENFEIDINHNMTELFAKIDKDDFYLLNVFLLFGLDGNNCFFNKLFNNKYSCSLLKKLIFFCHSKKNLLLINEYLTNFMNSVPYPSLLNHDISSQFLMPINNTINLKNNDFSSEEEQKLAMEEIKIKFGYLKSRKRGGYHCNHLGSCFNNPECDCNISHCFCDKFCICSKNDCCLLFKGCSCTDFCENIHEKRDKSICPCIREGRECDPEFCKNCNHCSNTKAFDRIFKKTRVSKSLLTEGAGLFAAEKIMKNELIGEYIGEVIEKEEVERRSIINIPFDRNYAFELDDFYDIDATKYGNKMRYINHSSFGYENCYARNVIVRGNTEILFYAKRDIKKGEEIYLDYHMNNCSWINKYNKIYGNKKK